MTEPSNIIVTASEPAVLGPLKRWLRTIVQVCIALAAAIPALAAVFNVSAETSAKLTGGMGALVALVSALHNAFNAQTSPPAYDDEGDIGIEQLLVIVVLVILIIVLLRNI